MAGRGAPKNSSAGQGRKCRNLPGVTRRVYAMTVRMSVRLCVKGENANYSPKRRARARTRMSAITNQGKAQFRIFEGSMNAEGPIDFMIQPVKDTKRKVYLILGNLRTPCQNDERVVGTAPKDDLSVLSADLFAGAKSERVLNHDLKAGIHNCQPTRSKEQLKQKTYAYDAAETEPRWETLQARKIRYAA